MLALLVLLVLAGCTEAPASPFGDADRGRRLLAQYQCGSCHVIPGVESARGTFATTLEAFGPRSYISGRIPNLDPWLIAWIIDPPALIPGTAMPNMGVSPDDARDIAAYLRSLK